MGKVRPVVIIQGNELLDAATPLVVVLPLTTRVYPAFRLWRVTLPARDRLKETCQIIVDQPRALDRARFGDGPLTTLTADELAAVEQSLRAVLGMY
ncbi:MAG: type II toxin-antitoxin system PemK/MazF family toxin [Burkholderiales bacterium]